MTSARERAVACQWSWLHCAWQLQLLLVHHHHLHTYVHPRVDSHMLLALQAVLCARRLMTGGLALAREAATRHGLPEHLAPFGVTSAFGTYIAAWWVTPGRQSIQWPMDYALLFGIFCLYGHGTLLTGSRQAQSVEGALAGSGDDDEADSTSLQGLALSNVHALAVNALEASLYVGGMPWVFAQVRPPPECACACAWHVHVHGMCMCMARRGSLRR